MCIVYVYRYKTSFSAVRSVWRRVCIWRRGFQLPGISSECVFARAYTMDCESSAQKHQTEHTTFCIQNWNNKKRSKKKKKRSSSSSGLLYICVVYIFVWRSCCGCAYIRVAWRSTSGYRKWEVGRAMSLDIDSDADLIEWF